LLLLLSFMLRPPPRPTLFPYTTLFRSADITIAMGFAGHMLIELIQPLDNEPSVYQETIALRGYGFHHAGIACADVDADSRANQRSEEHTSELQSRENLVCRLLLEKKKK